MIKVKVLIIVMLVALWGCAAKVNYPADLNPSMFATRNITSTDVYRLLHLPGDISSDSLLKRFDSIQDAKYLQPLMHDIGLWQFQVVRLISWQDKIGSLQPYVVMVDGEDYDGIEYVILDKDYKPVSELTVRGGWTGNDDDSTGYMVHTLTHSTFKGNEINLYKLHIRLWVADSIKHPCLVDSITYKVTIMPDGTMDTKRVDSVRYKTDNDGIFYRF